MRLTNNISNEISVTKIFTAFIGWNGMRLRMNEERIVEGAIQLALYACILFLYWLIQMISLIILLAFIVNANSISPKSNGPSDLATIELNNFVRCKFNDCCWAKKDKDLWAEENEIYKGLLAEREQELDLSPSPSSFFETGGNDNDGGSDSDGVNNNSSRRFLQSTSNNITLNANLSNSTNVTKFVMDFSPEVCFKNDREYPAFFGGLQFCGVGHFCEAVVFVNNSNLTSAPSPSNIGMLGRRLIVSAETKSFTSYNRRKLLSFSSNGTNTTTSAPITNAETTVTTARPANNDTDLQHSPSPSVGITLAPSPSSIELEPLFIREQPIYPGDPICDDLFKNIVTDEFCSDFDLWYEQFMKEFERKYMWIIYMVFGIACFELIGLINAVAANCWFCGPAPKIDIDEEYTDSESSSDEEDEDGLIHHHAGHHRGEKRHGSRKSESNTKKRKPKFYRVGVI